MFNVVFRNISGSLSNGAITWTSFESEAKFNEWYDDKMKGWYEVVEKNVTADEAVAHCSTPEAKFFAAVYHMREGLRVAQNILERAQGTR
jgi:hypothetical protein